MKMVFTYSDASANAETWKLSPQAAVNFLASHQKELSSALGNGNLSMLETAQKLINGSVAGTRYSPETLAPLLGMEPSQLTQLFLLYQNRHGNTENWKISVQEFLSFAAEEVLNNTELTGLAGGSSDGLNEQTASQLQAAKALTDAVISRKTYSPEEMAELLGGLTGLTGSSGRSRYRHGRKHAFAPVSLSCGTHRQRPGMDSFHRRAVPLSFRGCAGGSPLCHRAE